MDPRHLVQLAVILEKGSLTQASSHLHLTQPTLTHNMQTLEMQAGGTLFERSRFGVRPTPLGEILAREGRGIAQRLQDAQGASARHRAGLTTVLRIGAGPLIGASLLPGLTQFLLERFPHVALTVQSDRPHTLVEQLIDGRHDLVIAPSWMERPPAGLERTLLIEDQLGLYCGRAHPYSGKKTWRPAQAGASNWLSLGTASPFDQDVREMLHAAGIHPTRIQISVIGEAFSLLTILEQGRHLAVLPRFPLRRLAKRFRLAELPLPVPPRQRNIYLWCRTQLLESPAMQEVRGAVLEFGIQQKNN
jgi:DNA-binding transcriptional LysR family regulator